MRRKRIADRIEIDGQALGLPFKRRTVRRVVGRLTLPPALQIANVPAPAYVHVKIAGVPREIVVERVPFSLADDNSVLYRATRVIDDYQAFCQEIARQVIHLPDKPLCPPK